VVRRSLEGRLEALEARAGPPPEEPSEAFLRLKEFLDRYKAARQSRTVAEEMEAEMETIRRAIRERAEREGRAR
jgi:hypothetical protein